VDSFTSSQSLRVGRSTRNAHGDTENAPDLERALICGFLERRARWPVVARLLPVGPYRPKRWSS
jgi:hypothetical protein